MLSDSTKNLMCELLFTSDFCDEIVTAVFISYKTSPKELKQYMKNIRVNTPLPLASSAEQPNKDEAVEEFVSRYNKSELVH